MIHYGDMMMLCIEETNMKGCGVAKVEDMVVFCEGAVCGDTVIAFIEEVKKNYAKAKALKVVYPSKYRQEPLCPHFKECGGCTFGHISYEHETEVKKAGISASFRRAAGFTIEAEKVITGSESGYRNKAVFHFDNEKNAGFFKHGTREHLKIEHCDLCHDKIMEIKAVSEKLLKDDDGINGEKLTYLYIRYMEKTDEASVVIGYTGNSSLSDFAKKLSNSLPYIKCIMKGKEENPEARNEALILLCGEESITDVFCDMKIKISPRAFYQVNKENAEKMCTLAAELLELKAGDVCLDLYCGTGTIGMTVAKLSNEAKIYGVEINSAAVQNAKENAAANGISNIEFYCGDSKDFAEKTGVSKINSIIVDPPRAGLSKKAVSEIMRFAPEKIVYISCNPDTMARDLKALTEKYEIKKVTGIDLFPKTGHIETVALLSRQPSGNKKQAFFENTKLLSNEFGIVPLMYGSLGLEYLTSENLNADDIDVLIPKTFLEDRWNEFQTALEANGYVLIDENEHTFEKCGVHYSYAQIEELETFAGIPTSEIETFQIEGVSFKLLSLQQYLKVYTASSKDGYRVEIRNKKDAEKIVFIHEQLEKLSNKSFLKKSLKATRNIKKK